MRFKFTITGTYEIEDGAVGYPKEVNTAQEIADFDMASFLDGDFTPLDILTWAEEHDVKIEPV